MGGLFEKVSLERALRIMWEDTHSRVDKPEVLPGPATAMADGGMRSRLHREGNDMVGAVGDTRREIG